MFDLSEIATARRLTNACVDFPIAPKMSIANGEKSPNLASETRIPQRLVTTNQKALALALEC
jgi:hypothetical protein